MSGKAAKVQLTDRMFEILTKLSSSRNVSAAGALRVNIILLAFKKQLNQVIADSLGVSAKMVGIWRRRWRESYAALLRMQFEETNAGFRRAIIECLSDAPRSGLPGSSPLNKS